MSPGPNVEALKAEQRPGRCVACDDPLPAPRAFPDRIGRRYVTKRRKNLCGKSECKALYDAACRADSRLAAAEPKLRGNP